MICITGAGGTVGSEVVKQLQSAQQPFRLAYFSHAKAEAARTKGLEAVVIDYNKPENLQTAFKNCDRLFLLGPNAMNQTQLELNAVEAAKTAGVQYVVKQSIMGAVEESYSLAKVHRPIEKAIESSGLAWTFLRPNSFMQNVETFMSRTIRTEGALYSASGDGKISHVDVRDIATVAVQALTTLGHEKKAYTLTGFEAITYRDLANELSKALGHPIVHVSLSSSDLKQGMLADGMSEELADRMLDLERYFRENGASRVSDDIKQVTGKRPRRFVSYIREVADKGVWSAD